jgi:hypothetical protein
VLRLYLAQRRAPLAGVRHVTNSGQIRSINEHSDEETLFLLTLLAMSPNQRGAEYWGRQGVAN